MRRPRQSAVLFLICLLAVLLQTRAYSGLKTVEISPDEVQIGRSGPDTVEQTADTGADPNRFYDIRNPDHRTLQKADDVRATLPQDKRGAIDWMKALRSGAITPRADLAGSKPQEVLNLDVILKNTKEMPYVRFPHNSHTEWLACANCHDSLFVPKAGANPINMEKIFRGEYCGKCHDRVAFVTHSACERCHSVPHANSKQWW
jgi:c(7)-type cytochrome triheme protein